MEVNSLRSWMIAFFACCGIVQHKVLYFHERSEFTSCLLPVYFLLFKYLFAVNNVDALLHLVDALTSKVVNLSLS